MIITDHTVTTVVYVLIHHTITVMDLTITDTVAHILTTVALGGK
jgi:hypothetical protein